MIKTIAVAYRKSGMSLEEFHNYWQNVHAPLAVRVIPGLRRYVQNHVIQMPGREGDGDGIVEMWWDDMPAFRNFMAWVQTDAGQELRDDGDKFTDMTKSKMWITEEHIIK